ncbi:hypothetical protein LCGC14_2365810, partial [marine sediment metagenome]
MYIKIEPSGCTERRGLVQIRFAMYLEPSDYGYNKHHIRVPVIPEGGYTGELDAEGMPVDSDAYNAWVESLPKVWQNNPFHNHFIYVEPLTTDKVIMDIGEAFLNEAYIKWASEEKLDLKNSRVEYPT